jgi:hypothetical protein
LRHITVAHLTAAASEDHEPKQKQYSGAHYGELASPELLSREQEDDNGDAQYDNSDW